MVPGNRQTFKYTKKQQDKRSWFSTDCFFCWCTGYLAVPQDYRSDGSCFYFFQINIYKSLTYLN